MKSPRLSSVLVGLLGLLWLCPMYLIVVNASKPPAEYGSVSPWLPSQTFDLLGNMATAVERARFDRSILSTLLYAIASPTVAVLIGAALGYAIVALRLRHGFFWFFLTFGGTVIPVQMLLMPLFVGYARSGLYDTNVGMILVYVAWTLPFSAFVMRNFFTGIAYQTFEAAVMDGAGVWRTFWRIYLPMSASALVAVFILQSVAVWNELLLGLTLSQSNDVRTLMPSLVGLQGAYGGSSMTVVLAGGLMVSLPTVILFLCTQKFFTRGLSLGQY